MVVTVGGSDVFEQSYVSKLEALLSRQGLLVDYKLDRAALDGGVHLYKENVLSGDRELSGVRIWFQAKGIQSTTMSAAEFDALETLRISDLPVGHVRYWYAFPEPVYLVVYIESVDRFVAEDVRTAVDRIGGFEKLREIAATGQATMSLHLDAGADLVGAFTLMSRHRSMRIDGPQFRGRPLGHRLDPLRSELAPLSVPAFERLVQRILSGHDFREREGAPDLSRVVQSVGTVSAMLGTLYLTYEWTSPLFSEFGFGPDTEFRIESGAEHAQGDVLVVIHAEPLVAPTQDGDILDSLASELADLGVSRALIFLNAPDTSFELLGAWRRALGGLVSIPQGLGSIAFNVLTMTHVYLDLMDELEWKFVNYL